MFLENSLNGQITNCLISSHWFAMKGLPNSSWILGTIGIVIILYQNYFSNRNLPRIKIKHGEIEGLTSVSRDGRPFVEFLGIPFASPPVGSLRFEPPIPPKRWNGVLQTKSYSYKCIQFDLFTDFVLGDEDCLYLNVASPVIKPGNNQTLLPILLYIHGGVFTHGGVDTLRPDYFMDEDVILVTINYRLMAFGFLNTGDDLIRGNMGIKDVVMALHWVQENIRSFNGDPGSVTIMGHSAGGAIVNYLLLSETAKGLFHRAISMSGTAYNHWSLRRYPREQALRLARKFQCPSNSSSQLVKCLKSLDAHSLAKSHAEIGNIFHDPLSVFGPTIERIKHPDAVILEKPRKLVESGEIGNKVPYILGANSGEGLIYIIGAMTTWGGLRDLKKDWAKWAPRLLGFEEKVPGEISQKIQNFYIGTDWSYSNISNAFSMGGFYEAMNFGAKSHAKSHPTYLYYYNFEGEFAIFQIINHFTGWLPKPLDWAFALLHRWISKSLLGISEVFYGSSHGDETAMFFPIKAKGLVLSDLKDKMTPDFQFSKFLVSYWAHFAKFGTPPSINGIRWPSVNGDLIDLEIATPGESNFTCAIVNRHLRYMELSTEPKIIDEPFRESLDFWRNNVMLKST